MHHNLGRVSKLGWPATDLLDDFAGIRRRVREHLGLDKATEVGIRNGAGGCPYPFDKNKNQGYKSSCNIIITHSTTNRFRRLEASPRRTDRTQI